MEVFHDLTFNLIIYWVKCCKKSQLMVGLTNIVAAMSQEKVSRFYGTVHLSDSDTLSYRVLSCNLILISFLLNLGLLAK